MKILSYLNLSLLVTTICNAQDIATDGKGKPVFTYYSTSTARFELDEDEMAVTFSTKPDTITYVKVDGKKINLKALDTTVQKLSAFYIQPALLNLEPPINLVNEKDFSPGWKITLGYQSVIDTTYQRFDDWSFNYGINVYYAKDNFRLYNPVTDILDRQRPISYGTNLNLSILPKNTRSVMFAFTGRLEHGWNNEDLISFVESSPNNSIVTFDEVSGKYGELKTNITSGRMSAALLYTTWYLNFVPYFAIEANTISKEYYATGLYLNILSEKIDFRNYNAPSSFGIGIEWNKKADKWSDPQLFIRGSITIGEF